MADLAPFLGRLHACVEQAVQRYNERRPTDRIAHQARTRNNEITDFFFQQMAVEAEKDPDSLHLLELQQMRLVVVRQRYSLRFKLLGEDNLPNNRKTKQVSMYRGQQELDGLGKKNHLDLGYHLSSIGTLEDVMIVCPSEFEANAWVSEIKGAEFTSTIRPLFPTPTDPAGPSIHGKETVAKPKPGDAPSGA